ncbi:Eco57I restriction-modification methylase domain-containing protein [Ekhidna sp.]|uniref:Eco57I restriction-modification methylase domain-containing protein n=1 Tax=Ekhidna sp. TaxID=2608089 RepID=UPI003C7C3F09
MSNKVGLILSSFYTNSGSPKPGFTLLKQIRVKSGPIYDCYQILLDSVESALDDVKKCQLLERYHFYKRIEAYKELETDHTAEVLASTLIHAWIGGIVTGSIAKSANIMDAESWLVDELDLKDEELICDYLDEDTQIKASKILENLNIDEDFQVLLPYIFEVFQTKFELQTNGINRILKKKTGVYYTPFDVANFIVDRILKISGEDEKNSLRWLDPACGTGVFLICILRFLNKNCNGRNTLLDSFRSNVFGIDINPVALQSSSFVISLELAKISKCSFGKILKTVSENLVLFDSLQIESKYDLSKIFDVSFSNGFDILISNPPYSKVHGVKSKGLFGDQIEISDKQFNSYPHFVKLTSAILSENALAGMVVPLSISASTNPEFVSLRKSIQRNGGEWTFFHFDRTPDSLFGDDVKTRNTIFFCRKKIEKEGFTMETSELLRWNSNNRKELFTNLINPIKVDFEISKGIPKIGSHDAYKIYTEVIKQREKGSLSQIISKTKSPKEAIIRNSSTAYNWLTFESKNSNADFLSEDKKYSYWRSSEITEEFLIFGLVTSRFSYWLWRVEGDGFHLTDSFIRQLPYGPFFFENLKNEERDKLNELSYALWENMLNGRSEIYNAGRKSISYKPIESDWILDRIDQIILSNMNINPMCYEILKEIMFDTITAGRNDYI